MKRIGKSIFILVLLLGFTFPVFSQSMQLYDAQSDEYQSVQKLCQIAGVTGASTFTPVTGNELLLALDRISEEKLSEKDQNDYRALYAKIDKKDSFSYDIDLFISPSVNLADYKRTTRNSFFVPYNEIPPFMDVLVEMDFGHTASLDFGAALRNNINLNNGNSYIPTTSFDWLFNFRDGKFSFLSKSNPVGLNTEFPDLSRGAIGNRWFNVAIGRSRHQAGNGITGNLIVGDPYVFQEYLKLSLVSNYLTYNLDITHFDAEDENGVIREPRFSGFQELRVLHRFDVNLFNKVRAVLNWGFLLYIDSLSDFRLFTPLMLVHSWYNFRDGMLLVEEDEANNIMGFELDWSIIPGLDLGFQFVLDQFQTIWEGDSLPNAMGYLLNLSYIRNFKNMDVRFWGEFVFTDSALYLNQKYTQDGDSIKLNYNYDWALGYYNRESKGDIAWSGYKDGPDAIVFAFGTNIDLYEYRIKLNPYIKYRIQGSIELGDLMTSHMEKTPSGIAEHTLEMMGDINWKAYKDKIDVFFALDLKCIWNYEHVKNLFKFVPQAYVGATFKIL